MNGLCDIGGTVVTGIVAGLISSILLFVVELLIRPRIKISSQVCENAARNTYSVKIVNHSLANLMSVEYTMHLCHHSDDGIIQLTPLDLKRMNLSFIPKYSRRDPDSKYAVRLSFEVDKNTLCTKDDYLRFSIGAKHALTGTTAFFSKEYHLEDIRCGRFETGKSLKILYDSVGSGTGNFKEKITI